eukprot:TRINITY_DN2149_c0_g1_i1.p1 TRINITY_DN2149_c0_g1~~TRINITY_DN2149_c0_g1_i1.p1  ORF type:complete len:166 (-),score=59.19 TRINITY_DN2149_c0_g1_i1:335-832(-)
MKHHQEQIEAKLERIFLNQIESLSDAKSPPTSDDEGLGEEFGEDFERELEDELLVSEESPKKRRSAPGKRGKRKGNISDEEEAFNNFLKDDDIHDQPPSITETTKTISIGVTGEKVESGLIRLPHEPSTNQRYYLKEQEPSWMKQLDLLLKELISLQMLKRSSNC